jgi:tetratricopeptide (TPR) repeat protein
LFRQRVETLGGTLATVRPTDVQVPRTLDDSPRRLVEVAPEQSRAALEEEEPEVEFVDVDLADEGGEPTGEIVRPGEYVFGVAPPPPAAVEPASNAPTTAMELFTEAVVFAKYGLSDKAVSHLHRVLALEPTHQAARDLLGSLGGGEVAEVEFGTGAVVEAAVPRQPEPAPFPGLAPSFEEPARPALPMGGLVPDIEIADVDVSRQPVEQPRVTDPPVIVPLPVSEVSSPPSRPGLAPVRLENLEAILGLGEAAPKAARPAPTRAPRASLEEQIGFDLAGLVGVPSRPETSPPPLAWGPAEVAQTVQPPPKANRPAVRAEEPPPFEAPPVQAGRETTTDEVVELLEVPGMLGGPADEVLREIDFFIEQGLLDEAARQLGKLREQFPDHGEVKSRQALLKARGWEEGALSKAVEASAAELFSEEEQFFDLAAELEKELAEDELVAEARGEEQSGEVSIEELFKEFQRGVAEQIHEEDYDTHFNLGLAYREMGLLDEAIGEFQLAAKSGPLFIEAASMIGASYLEKGLPEQAAEWFSRALTAPDIPAEAELGLKYELGRAHEAAGNLSGALSNFAEVLALNPGFRDIVERVSRLQITH